MSYPKTIGTPPLPEKLIFISDLRELRLCIASALTKPLWWDLHEVHVLGLRLVLHWGGVLDIQCNTLFPFLFLSHTSLVLHSVIVCSIIVHSFHQCLFIPSLFVSPVFTWFFHLFIYPSFFLSYLSCWLYHYWGMTFSSCSFHVDSSHHVVSLTGTINLVVDCITTEYLSHSRYPALY